jgi:hypothetical protein
MQDNMLDINDELMKLVREAINNGFGLIQEEDRLLLQIQRLLLCQSGTSTKSLR